MLATNAIGPGPASDPSSGVYALCPARRLRQPGSAPREATRGRDLTWTAPADNGSAITGYLVTSAPDGRTCPWTTGPLTCTVTGLANGQAYTFTVTATNGNGTGPASAASNSVTPAGLPSAPGGTAAVAGNHAALVSWTAAAENGAAVTAYAVTSSPDSHVCTTTGALSCVVAGLDNGTPYTFTVTAKNDVGTGPASAATGSVTPIPVPDPPTSATAIGSDGSARVAWVAPLSNGGSPITGYAVTSSPDGKTCTTPGPLSCTVGGLANGTAYTFTVTASNAVGPSLPSAPSAVVMPLAGATYVALTPVRLLDTRTGNGLGGAFVSAVPRTFAVAGRGGVPATATAVTGILTVTGSTSGGYVALGPLATATPSTSTLNFPRGDTRATGVTVTLGAGGTLSAVFRGSGGTTALVFDVTGYFTPDTSGATYVALTPVRLLDTRTGNGLGGAFVSAVPRTFAVAGRGGVPATATAVTGILTVTGSTSGGYVALGPLATATPSTSTLNFPRGDTRATGVTVTLGAGGTLSAVFRGSGGTTALVFDVTGYFTPDTSGATYVALTPVRLLDTRTGNGLGGAFVSAVPRTFAVAGRGGVPATATAVTGILTVTGSTSGGYVALGPLATATPSTSTLNFPRGDTRATGVTVTLGAGGTLSAVFRGSGGTTALVFDVTGYFVHN